MFMNFLIVFLFVMREICVRVAAHYAAKLLDEWLEEDEKSE